jgi:hypothetical protein
MSRVEVVALLGSVLLLIIVLELVRQRVLSEGYSLLWLLTTAVLVVMALWRDLLHAFARAVGIYYPPSALFVVGFGFVLLILLQFSVLISRLSKRNTRLAQRLAVLEWMVQNGRPEADRHGPRMERVAADPGGETE